MKMVLAIFLPDYENGIVRKQICHGVEPVAPLTNMH